MAVGQERGVNHPGVALVCTLSEDRDTAFPSLFPFLIPCSPVPALQGLYFRTDAPYLLHSTLVKGMGGTMGLEIP